MNSVSLPSQFFPIKEISPEQRQKIAKDASNNNKWTPLTGVPDSVAQRSTGKIAESLKAGLIASVATFGNVFAGYLAYEETLPYYRQHYYDPVPLLFSTTVLSGILAASREYSRISKKEDSNDKTNAAPMEKPASTFEKVTEAVKAAWTGFGVSFSTCCAAVVIFNVPKGIAALQPMFGISTLVGLGQAAKTYRSVAIGEPKSSTSKSLVLDEPKASVVRKNNASKIVQSQRAAVLACAAVFGTFMTGIGGLLLAQVPPYKWDGIVLPSMAICMAISGLHAYSQKFLALSKEEQLPDKLTVAPPVKHSTLVKMAKSLKAGWNSYAVSLTLGLIGGVALSGNSRDFQVILPVIVGTSALYGISQGVNTYKSLEGGGPTLKEQWNKMSKTKKRCIVAASLACLAAAGVLYIGPKKAMKITRSGFESAKNFVFDLFHKMAYTVKTKTETKTIDEWRNGFTDQEELEMLASMPSDATCAHILHTCRTPADDLTSHKKVYRTKGQKYHPDKYHNPVLKNLAKIAQINLNKARDSMDECVTTTEADVCVVYDDIKCVKKDNGICTEYKCLEMDKQTTCTQTQDQCSGQNEGFCVNIDDDMSRDTIVKIPNWLYRQFGSETQCLQQWDGGPIEKVDMSQCAGI